MTNEPGVDDTVSNDQDPAKLRILVVDDEVDVCAVLVRMLNMEGFLAEAANSGYEALSLLENQAYDLMILDIRMPELDGLAVMEQVRQLYPELLIIILTGHATLESAIAATKSDQVVDYLIKPAGHEDFMAAVDRVAQKLDAQRRQRRLLETAGQVLEVMAQPELLNGEPSALPDSTGRFLSVPPLFLDRKRRLVTIEDVPADRLVELTNRETALLAGFMSAPNRVLSCRRLAYLALGHEIEQAEAARIVRPHISRLRQKLETNPKTPRLICTVRGRGYYFRPANS